MPPVLTVQCSFSTNPMATPVWTDISHWVQSIDTRRGRNTELDRVEAGTATILLDNRDRRFDPSNATSPYYPNVIPLRRIQILASWSTYTYPVFTGYVEGWPQAYSRWDDINSQVTVSDAFKVFNLVQLNTAYPQQRSDARVGAVLDTITWGSGQGWQVGTGALDTTTVLAPVGDRSISAGQSTIQASTLSNTSALQHLQDVTLSENGLLFMEADGSVVFFGRQLRYVPPYSESQALFGDAVGELPYVSLVFESDDRSIYNDVRVTRQGGATQTVADATSQGQYFPRTLTRTLLITSDAEASDAANWLLSRYKQPIPRISQMMLDLEIDANNLCPQLMVREIGDKITVRRRPPSGGPMIEQVSRIEGISHHYAIAEGVWQTTWNLSAVANEAAWVLDSSSASVLGSTTIPAY